MFDLSGRGPLTRQRMKRPHLLSPDTLFQARQPEQKVHAPLYLERYRVS